jgi:anti-sigma regulatory factor (Ser/Thr protein kinase)
VVQVNGQPAGRDEDGVTLAVRGPEGVAVSRQAVLGVAADAGLDAETANFLAYAVSEVVTNALVHGGGQAEVRIAETATAVTVDIQDHGPGFTPVDASRPDPGDERGRGLWLVEELVDAVDIDSGPHGTRVRLTMARA